MKLDKVIITGVILLLALSAGAFAQDGYPIDENSSGNFFGIGARGIGMGGAQIAAGLDGTALVYNPALLARIRRIELLAGISHQSYSNDGNTIPATTDNASILPSDGRSKSFTNLNALNLSIPVPTYRGSAVVAFGINRSMSFDHVFQYARGYVLNDATELGTELSSGGVNQYSLGGAMDLSPRVSVGVSLNLYHGKEDYTWEYHYEESGANPQEELVKQYITADYTGISAKVGLSYNPNERLSLGLIVESPISFSIDGEDLVLDWSYPNVYEYELQHPFTFGAGFSYKVQRFNFAFDAYYTDWTQMKYTEYPDLAIANRLIDEYYRETIRFNAGVEYILPLAGTKVRAGYIHDPLPYADNLIEDDRNFVTLGVGFLVDRVMTVDIAYVHGSYEFARPYPDEDNNISVFDASFEKYTADRIFITTAFRF